MMCQKQKKSVAVRWWGKEGRGIQESGHCVDLRDESEKEIA